jgi:hypothetical protein
MIFHTWLNLAQSASTNFFQTLSQTLVKLNSKIISLTLGQMEDWRNPPPPRLQPTRTYEAVVPVERAVTWRFSIYSAANQHSRICGFLTELDMTQATDFLCSFPSEEQRGLGLSINSGGRVARTASLNAGSTWLP